MKNKELAEELLKRPDDECSISLDPIEEPAENYVRYFGEILEVMDDNGRTVILTEGKRNGY